LIAGGHRGKHRRRSLGQDFQEFSFTRRLDSDVEEKQGPGHPGKFLAVARRARGYLE
jgi:hypothetical protein